MELFWFILSYLGFVEMGAVPVGPSPTAEGKIWALLVAGSNGFSNYRHQADVCHAYQILHSNGIPDENVVVMMYDDIADNEENPTPGIIINHPGGPNVYKGVPKDYTKDDVTAENFLNILSGNKTAMKGIGSGKVIESGPSDVIFVNFVDHGGPGVLCFPNDDLMADQLLKTISKMHSAKKFYKLVMYIEACHSGSMFDNLLSDNTNVFALTASDPYESSFACYFDDSRQTFLGDVFSVAWMNDTEHESLPMESIHHQFERVRSFTNGSHVEEYGDLDVGSSKLKDILGFRMRLNNAGRRGRHNPSKPPPILDAVDNMYVPLSILENKIQREQNSTKKTELKLEKRLLLKRRHIVNGVFADIMERVSYGSTQKENELRRSQYGLSWKNFPCYRELYKAFNKRCMSVLENPYARAYLQTLVNMCSVPWLNTEEMVEDIHTVCTERRVFSNLRAI